MPQTVSRCVLAFVGLCSVFTADASAQRGRSTAPFPLRVDSVHVVGRAAGLGDIMDAKLGPDGSVYVLDGSNARVHKFAPDGREVWRVGRKGGGPGEFQLPYRIAIRPNGELLVYDFMSRELSRFTREGQFVSRTALSVPFRQVDGILPLPSGGLALSGVATEGTSPYPFGIHVFDDRGTHVRSFGPLPPTTDSAVRRMWGAGLISLSRAGEILYALRLPYEIYTFSVDGVQRRVIRSPIRIDGTPDDAISIVRDGRRTEYREGKDVARPERATELNGGWILGGRFTRDTSFWDLYDPQGRLVGSRRLPEEWKGVIGFDAARNALWLIGTRDLEPVVLRLTIYQPSQRRSE